MYMDEVFRNDWNVNEYVTMNEMFDEKDHKRRMYRELKDYFHLNEIKKIKLIEKMNLLRLSLFNAFNERNSHEPI